VIVEFFSLQKKYAMARRTIEMEVKKQIGILQSLGYGKKTIAWELGLSKNTVKSYLDVSEDKDGDSLTASREKMFDLKWVTLNLSRELGYVIPEKIVLKSNLRHTCLA
jgi:orotate phosphoribosyltransferase-like protein